MRTPSDFGLRSEPPSHPHLLDYLASYLIDHGWSLKALHRLILLSSTYRQKSDGDPRYEEVDPENRWLWRMYRRRLEFEALRDSLLAVAGQLDLGLGGRPVDTAKEPFPLRRSVYAYIDRQRLPQLLRTFDFASPDATHPKRSETTVPQQALYLMNSGFAVDQAQRLRARPDVRGIEDPAARIQRLYEICYGRPAEVAEVEVGLRYIEAENGTEDTGLDPWAKYVHALLMSNEFVFVD